ncbi:hypothetical protein [Tenacibaculum dicentrarchi]|uniref:hypothetical protein n=1 Tax=Tenacibaculum dicentrarchi TaxID=669041 RepID=UPI0035126DA6
MNSQDFFYSSILVFFCKYSLCKWNNQHQQSATAISINNQQMEQPASDQQPQSASIISKWNNQHQQSATVISINNQQMEQPASDQQLQSASIISKWNNQHQKGDELTVFVKK